MLFRDIFDAEIESVHIDETDDGDKVGKVVAMVGTLDYKNKNNRNIQSSGVRDSYRVSISPYNHGSMYGEAPVGVGTLSKKGKRLRLEAEMPFVLDGAEQAYLRIKHIDSMQYSIGYYAEEYDIDEEDYSITVTKTDIFEASPVIYGASKGTRTVKTSDGFFVDEYTARAFASMDNYRLEKLTKHDFHHDVPLFSPQDITVVDKKDEPENVVAPSLEEFEDAIIMAEVKKRGLLDDFRQAQDIQRVVASIREGR